MNMTPDEHTRHTVLVVDDEDRTRETLQDLLQRDGHEVLGAQDGKEALAILEWAAPCIIMTDVMMPRMDGYALCRAIRSMDHTAHIPVIMVSGCVRIEDVEQSIDAGAVDYVKKPFDSAEVRMRVNSQIRLDEIK